MDEILRKAYNAYQREYRKKNLEKRRKYGADYMREYRKKNPDYYEKEKKIWRETKKEERRLAKLK